MEIPKKVEKLINAYFNLQIGNKSVKTPYYINKKHSRGGELRSLVGKGAPNEIEEEVNIFAKLRGFNLKKASEKEIRLFMKSEGIGIDCSGLVAHILDTWLGTKKKGTLYSNLKFKNRNFFDKLIKYLRPIQNISAHLLTNEENSVPVKLSEVQVGDLLRIKGLKHGHHVAIFTNIDSDEEGRRILRYVHSTPYYGNDNGVRFGEILIIDEEKDLDKQRWLEFDKKNVCWTLKQYLKEQEDNGIRRPKFFLKQP
jgi:hypothetical protein